MVAGAGPAETALLCVNGAHVYYHNYYQIEWTFHSPPLDGVHGRRTEGSLGEFDRACSLSRCGGELGDKCRSQRIADIVGDAAGGECDLVRRVRLESFGR